MALMFGTVFVVCLITFLSTLLYVLSSFGNAILFHLLWQICAAGDRAVCSGSVPDAVLYITIAELVSASIQTYTCRKDMNWPLAIHLTGAQLVGGVFGTLLLFAVTSVWVVRVLGCLFFYTATVSIVREANFSATSEIDKWNKENAENEIREHESFTSNPLQQSANLDSKWHINIKSHYTKESGELLLPDELPTEAGIPSISLRQSISDRVINRIPSFYGNDKVEVVDTTENSNSFCDKNVDMNNEYDSRNSSCHDENLISASNEFAEVHSSIGNHNVSIIQEVQMHNSSSSAASELKENSESSAGLSVSYKLDTRNRVMTVWIVGLCAGFLGGLFGTGGPPLMLFVMYTHLPKNESRGSMSLAFFCISVERMVLMFIIPNDLQLGSSESSVIAILIVISTLASIWTGEQMVPYVSEIVFRRLIMTILSVGSVMIMTSGTSIVIQASVCGGSLVFFCVLGYIAYKHYAKKLTVSFALIATTEVANENGTSIESDIGSFRRQMIKSSKNWSIRSIH